MEMDKESFALAAMLNGLEIGWNRCEKGEYKKWNEQKFTSNGYDYSWKLYDYTSEAIELVSVVSRKLDTADYRILKVEIGVANSNGQRALVVEFVSNKF